MIYMEHIVLLNVVVHCCGIIVDMGSDDIVVAVWAASTRDGSFLD